MRIFPTDFTFDYRFPGSQAREGTIPRPMALSLTVIAVIVIQHANHHFVIGFKNLFQLVVLLAIENFMNFFHAVL